MEYPKAIIALVIVFGSCAYVMDVERGRVQKEIATACTTTHEFTVNGTTIHCGVIRKEVLAQTKKRRQEELAESCTKYMMGLEQ